MATNYKITVDTSPTTGNFPKYTSLDWSYSSYSTKILDLDEIFKDYGGNLNIEEISSAYYNNRFKYSKQLHINDRWNRLPLIGTNRKEFGYHILNSDLSINYSNCIIRGSSPRFLRSFDITTPGTYVLKFNISTSQINIYRIENNLEILSEQIGYNTNRPDFQDNYQKSSTTMRIVMPTALGVILQGAGAGGNGGYEKYGSSGGERCGGAGGGSGSTVAAIIDMWPRISLARDASNDNTNIPIFRFTVGKGGKGGAGGNSPGNTSYVEGQAGEDTLIEDYMAKSPSWMKLFNRLTAPGGKGPVSYTKTYVGKVSNWVATNWYGGQGGNEPIYQTFNPEASDWRQTIYPLSCISVPELFPVETFWIGGNSGGRAYASDDEDTKGTHRNKSGDNTRIGTSWSYYRFTYSEPSFSEIQSYKNASILNNLEHHNGGIVYTDYDDISTGAWCAVGSGGGASMFSDGGNGGYYKLTYVNSGSNSYFKMNSTAYASGKNGALGSGGGGGAVACAIKNSSSSKSESYAADGGNGGNGFIRIYY